MSKVTIFGGAYQNLVGEAIATGTLKVQLSNSANPSPSVHLVSGLTNLLALDNNGNVSTASAQVLWATDTMTPNATYAAWVYAADGQRVYGPIYGLQIPSTPQFNVVNWLPTIASS